MARLPQPGSDNGTWGDILNDFLSAAHNSDGSLKSSSLSAAGAVTSSDLSTLLRTTDAVAVYNTSTSSYPVRSSVTSDTSRPVRWRGPIAPVIGGAYAIDGLDVWEMTP